MKKWTLIGLQVLIGLTFRIDNTLCLRLLAMKVPSLADPRDNLTLDCQYDMGNDELYSVKWYKDEQEFFRYTPRQQPHLRSFRVPGVYLAGKGNCTNEHCTVQLTSLTTSHSSGAYRCEVSTEGPTFKIVFDTTNVTVAAIGRENPKIEGIAPTYSIGELVVATCTSSPADPAPTISWVINEKQAPPLATSQPRTFSPQNFTSSPQLSLVSRAVLLKFHTEKHHFSDTGVMEVQCIASTPALKAPSLVTAVTAHLHRDMRLSNQKLEWPSGTGSIMLSRILLFNIILMFFLSLKNAH